MTENKPGKIGDDYTCRACGGVFQRTRDDDDPELAQEQIDNFGLEHADDDEIVCDDCYKLIVDWYDRKTPAEKEEMLDEERRRQNKS